MSFGCQLSTKLSEGAQLEECLEQNGLWACLRDVSMAAN